MHAGCKVDAERNGNRNVQRVYIGTYGTLRCQCCLCMEAEMKEWVHGHILAQWVAGQPRDRIKQQQP